MFVAAGFALVYTGITADLIGLGPVAAALAVQALRRAPAATPFPKVESP